jgi:hypothetical protein
MTRCFYWRYSIPDVMYHVAVDAWISSRTSWTNNHPYAEAGLSEVFFAWASPHNFIFQVTSSEDCV